MFNELLALAAPKYYERKDVDYNARLDINNLRSGVIAQCPIFSALNKLNPIAKTDYRFITWGSALHLAFQDILATGYANARRDNPTAQHLPNFDIWVPEFATEFTLNHDKYGNITVRSHLDMMAYSTTEKIMWVWEIKTISPKAIKFFPQKLPYAQHEIEFGTACTGLHLQRGKEWTFAPDRKIADFITVPADATINYEMVYISRDPSYAAGGGVWTEKQIEYGQEPPVAKAELALLQWINLYGETTSRYQMGGETTAVVALWEKFKLEFGYPAEFVCKGCPQREKCFVYKDK